ncbi:epiphycan [Brienomyrus brachyistius]|uniref:epiphycan n=1 Tax=Brienomyrus brachyistius TaxID=42636 RepID=UPI0020B45C66|nr:epiphycan [Brienomyrus brachyistius]
MKTLEYIVCGFFILKTLAAFPYTQSRLLDLDVYDTYGTDPNLLNEDLYDYGFESITGEPEMEIGTLPPLGVSLEASFDEGEEEDELPLRPFPTAHSSGGSGAPAGPEISGVPPPGAPTCQLCVCLGSSVYCEDAKLEAIPELPKDTTHFYARYNKISSINKNDFAHMSMLKRIDLTGNQISRIDDDAFLGLTALEELILGENKLTRLPALPANMVLIDVSHNKLGSRGIHKEAFKDMHNLQNLYLSYNNIGYVPMSLPDSLRSLHLQNNNIQMMLDDTFCNLKDLNYIRRALEDIRLDGNPINLSRTPQAYICLPRLPVGGLV